MTWHLTLLLPSFICGIVGYVCAMNASMDSAMGDNVGTIKNSIATAVCGTGAAVSLLGALQ